MSMKREENFHARKIPVPWLAMSDEVWAISLMTMNVGFNGGVTIGCVLRTIDVSPNHAGIVMGFVNTLANVVSLLTSLVAGSMVTDAHNRSEWQIVFVIAACVFFVSNLIYIMYCIAEAQPRDAPDYLLKNSTEESTKTARREIFKRFGDSSDARVEIEV